MPLKKSKKLKAPTVVTRVSSYMDSMTIDSGHTMMANYLPDTIDLTQFNENFYKWAKPTPETIAQFGLFGSELNYNTYYPELNLEDLNPEEDEFIQPVFRLLSATIVSKGWNPTDFSQNGVLKASMGLLLGQTVNTDHSTDIGNAIGSVAQVSWQEAYTDAGIKIPAGINGVLKIDGKANPRIARGILMEPPSIHSNSVTVQFAWEQSHPKMDKADFYQKLGTYDEKGELIRRMVTEVVRYHETSLVSHGADPYAQKITQDGKLNNPIFANRTYNSFKEYEDDKNKIYCYYDCKSYSNNAEEDNTSEFNNINEEPKIEDNPNNNNQKTTQMNEELLAFIASLFGNGMLELAEGQEASQELAVQTIQQLIASRGEDATTIQNLTTERDSLSERVTNLEAQVNTLSAQAEVGKTYLTQLREEAVEVYRKLMGDSVDETIINMLSAETTGINTLKSLMKDYTQRLEEKFPMKCQKCGSHDVSRASSTAENSEDHSVEDEKTTDAIINSLYNNKIKK